MKQKIIFFGSSKFVIPILELLRTNFNLVLVITTEKLPTEPVSSYSKTNEIPLLSIQQFNNKAIKQLQAVHAPFAVLAYFGLIVPNKILNLFPKGIINIHPSLLPKYRGPTPVQTAILNGDFETGVTIIKLDEEVDHGPILQQEKEKIYEHYTAESLHTRLFEKGAQMLASMIRIIEVNKPLEEREQDHSKATFTEHLSRQSGYFDSNNPPDARKLDRMIKAYHPWPGAWTKLRVKNLELRVKFIPEKKLQVEGKKPMSYKDFLNGYPEMKPWIEQLKML